MHTLSKSTRAKLFFYQKATISALYMLHLTTPSFRYRTKPWAKYHDLPMQHLWKWGRLGSKGSSMWQLLRLVSHILHAYQLVPLQRTPKINISWICNNCGIPNFSSSIFESAEVTTSNSFQDISNEDLLMNNTSANSDTSEFPLHCSSPLKSAPIKKIRQ